MHQERSNARRWLERLLLIGGLAAVLVAGWFLAGADLWRQWEDRKFSEAQMARQEEDSEPESPTAPPATGDVVARLSIPRLNVKSVVREGASDSVLSLALGHIEGTALPGQVGNVGVAGHRDTLFRGLRNVAVKDQIVVETVDKKYVYQVETTQIVKPTDVQVLDPTPKESELTLVTCYPFNYIGSAPKRFIVKAKLMPQETEAKTLPVPIEVSEKPTPAVKAKVYRAPRPAPYQEAPAPSRVNFSVTAGHSRELLPNKVWFGLSRADDDRADGWIWIAAERRTVWLRDAEEGQPISFQNGGKKYQLVITRRDAGSVNGYIVSGRS